MSTHYAHGLDSMDPVWYPIVLGWLSENRPEVLAHALDEVVTHNAIARVRESKGRDDGIAVAMTPGRQCECESATCPKCGGTFYAPPLHDPLKQHMDYCDGTDWTPHGYDAPPPPPFPGA